MFYNPVRSWRNLDFNRQAGETFQDNNELECHGDWLPNVDVKETSENLILYAEVPGLQKSDIALTVRDKVLSLSGEKVQSEAGKDENFHRTERVYGKFCRRFALPSQVDVTKIKAELLNGVLKVTLPKQERAKAQEIKIS